MGCSEQTHGEGGGSHFPDSKTLPLATSRRDPLPFFVLAVEFEHATPDVNICLVRDGDTSDPLLVGRRVPLLFDHCCRVSWIYSRSVQRPWDLRQTCLISGHRFVYSLWFRTGNSLDP